VCSDRLQDKFNPTIIYKVPPPCGVEIITQCVWVLWGPQCAIIGPHKEFEHRTKQWMSDDSWQMALLYLPAQLCNAFASSAVVPEGSLTWSILRNVVGSTANQLGCQCSAVTLQVAFCFHEMVRSIVSCQLSSVGWTDRGGEVEGKLAQVCSTDAHLR